MSPFSRPYFALLIVSALALWPLFFGRFYGIGDTRSVYIPIEHFFAEQQRHFNLPAWMPDTAWGFPVIASAQIGFFYPPLLLTRFLPIFIYLPLLLWLHIFFLGIGAYRLARTLNISQNGALITALSIALNAFLWQHLTHLNIIFALAWFPWQLLAAHYLARSHRPNFKQFAGLVFTLGLPFLAGQLQVPFLTALFSTIYYFVSLPKKPFPSRHLLIFLGATLLTITLTAVQTFPTLELTFLSSRGSTNEFSLERANQHSFPIYHLPTLLFPRFFGSDNTYWGKRIEIEYGFFFGVIPLCLSFIAIFNKSRRYRFWIISGFIAFLLSLGEFSPFRLVGLEPSLWYFSAPARWLFFTVFSGSILAGFGYDLLPNISPRYLRILKSTIVTILSCVILYNLVLWLLPENFASYVLTWLQSQNLTGARDSAYYLDKINSLLSSAKHTGLSLASPYTYITLIPLLAIPWLFQKHHSWLIPLTAIELILIASTANPSVTWSNILTPPASISALPQSVTSDHARIISISAPGDTGLWLTNPETRADTARREQYRQQLEPLTHSLFNLAGSQWPASLDLQSQAHTLENLLESRQDQLYIDSDKAAALNIGAALIANEAPHTVSEVLPQNIAPNIFLYSFSPQPRASLLTEDQTELALPYDNTNPNHQTYTLSSSTPATLIIRDTWYPGWQATLDDQPVNIDTYNNIFRSVSVPSGSHTVSFTYHPTWLYYGLAISLTTLGFLIFVLMYNNHIYTVPFILRRKTIG